MSRSYPRALHEPVAMAASKYQLNQDFHLPAGSRTPYLLTLIPFTYAVEAGPASQEDFAIDDRGRRNEAGVFQRVRRELFVGRAHSHHDHLAFFVGQI